MKKQANRSNSPSTLSDRLPKGADNGSAQEHHDRLERLIIESFERDRDAIPVHLEGTSTRGREIIRQRRIGASTEGDHGLTAAMRAMRWSASARFVRRTGLVCGMALCCILGAVYLPGLRSDGESEGTGVFDSDTAGRVTAANLSMNVDDDEGIYVGVRAQPLPAELQAR